jgi:hypothetical protein
MSLFNSIGRGFGLTLGRKAADNMIDSFGQSSEGNPQSPSLSGKQIVQTILWGFIMMLLSSVISTFLFVANVVNKETVAIPFILLTVLFTFIIGKDYYNSNKKRIQSLNHYNQVNQEKTRLINETEELYISEKITKREYEVLMKKINKM